MRTPTGLPSSCTSTASALSSAPTASEAGSVEPMVGQRRRHVLADAVGEPGRAGEEQVEQRPLGDRADDLGGDDRRLGADDRHLRDGVLLQDRDRLGDGLAGVGVHQVGQPPVLAAQHLADGLHVPLGASTGKPYCASQSSLKTLVR